LSDLLVLVVYGADGKFVPSSVLSGDEDGDVDGASLAVSLGDGSGGESSSGLMSERTLDRISAKSAGTVVFIPLVAESTAVALVILVISGRLEAKTPGRSATRRIFHVSMGLRLMEEPNQDAKNGQSELRIHR